MGSWLVPHLVGSLLLAVGVAVICKLGKFRPAICHALWLVVLLKLMIPPVVAWPWALGDLDFFSSVTSVSSAPAADTTLNAATALPQQTASGSQASEWTYWTPPLISRMALVRWGVPGVWVMGALMMAAMQAVRLRRFKTLLASGQPAPGWLESELTTLSSKFNVSQPRLVVVPGTWSAMTWGARRPVILIPAEVLDALERDKWRGVLAHELAHIKRRDVLTGWLELLAGCVWWWNPVFWYVRRRLHVNAEMACDAWVVDSLPEHRRSYAAALVGFLELASSPQTPLGVLTMASGPAVAFERRLTMIIREHVPCRMSIVGMVLVTLTALAFVPGCQTGAKAKPEAAQTKATAADASHLEPVEALLDAPIGIEFEGVHISEILQFVAETYEMNLILDSRVVEPVAKPGAQKQEQPPVGSHYVTDGIVSYINIKDMPLRQALTALLRPLGLTFTTVGNSVFISTAEMIAADAAKAKPAPRASVDPKLLQKMKAPVSFEFEDVYLGEVIEFLVDTYGLMVLIDNRVIQPMDGDPLDGKVPAPAYVTDGMVPYVNIKDLPLEIALELLLRPLNLTFVPEKNFIRIGTVETLAVEFN